MGSALDRCAEQHRKDAVAELVAELAEFSYDGLVQLQSDLERGSVLRGSWGGCVISYKQGSPGSTRRDRMGRARNAFTVLWDNGWMTDREVASAVARELASRVPESQPSRVPGSKASAPAAPADPATGVGHGRAPGVRGTHAPAAPPPGRA